MLKGISLPSIELVDPGARMIFSVSPVSVSPNGQLAVVDVLYSTDAGQLHAFMLVDLANGTYLTNYNAVVGQGDETSIKTWWASVSWSLRSAPTLSISYEDLTDDGSSGIYNRIAKVTGATLSNLDLIEASTTVVADGSIQKLLTDSTGRYLAFETAAKNLAPAGSLDTNEITDVYLLDTLTDTLTRISALADGTDASDECKLQDVAIVDGKVSVLFSTISPAIFSADDTNNEPDLYLWRDSQIALVSTNAEGSAGGYDGGIAAFVGDDIALLAIDLASSDADGLLDLYLVDTVSLTKHVNPIVNALAFASDYDLWIEGNNDSEVVLGIIGASQGDTNLSNQILAVHVDSNASDIYTLNSGGTLADDISDTPAISDLGNTIAYRTSATNLATQDSLAFIVNHTNTTTQGNLALTGSVRVGQTVAVDLTSFEDVDGYGAGLTYKWTLDGQLQSSVSGRSFTFTEAMLGQTLQLTIEYTDNWGVSESISLGSSIEVGNRGIELTINGKTLNHGTITADLDGSVSTVSSDSHYFDLQGTTIGTVTLDPAMHTSDIGIGDVIASLRHIVGLSPLSGKAALAADVDNDSNIGIGDVIAQLRHIVGLSPINRFDVVDVNGETLAGSLQNYTTVELILNGDVDLSTHLTPTFFDF
jgi:hypothetical protein